MLNCRTMKDMDFKDKRVIVRVGMDVPVDKDGNITNDKRVKEGMPTINYLLDHGARQIIIINHIGRPKSKDDLNLRHNKLAAELSTYLGKKVPKLDDCINVELPADKVVLLENLRFHAEETGNDNGFAEKIASLADIYVNDAFSVSHREQASVTGIPKFLPSCAGLLLEKEITVMGNALSNPHKPFIVLLGGAKVSDKLGLIKNLLPKVDKILLGGAMIFTFFKAKGYDIGSSKVEADMVEQVKQMTYNDKIVLPDDIVIADRFDADAKMKVIDKSQNYNGWMGLDIGPHTVRRYENILSTAKTVVWNGPMGVFEFEKFAVGTNEIAKFLSRAEANVIVGGGDSASAIEKLELEDKFTHVSTGGGASLEFLEGKTLPGIQALEENKLRFG